MGTSSRVTGLDELSKEGPTRGLMPLEEKTPGSSLSLHTHTHKNKEKKKRNKEINVCYLSHWSGVFCDGGQI